MVGGPKEEAGDFTMYATTRDRIVSAIGAVFVGLVFAGAAVLPAQMAAAATLGL
jgi:hypothetical protein